MAPAPPPRAPLEPPAPVRPARAAMFATACTVLAIAGHMAAGRTTVAPRAVVVGFVALYLVAWVLTGTERSLATILGGLLGGQFMLHALFAAAAPTAGIAAAHSMRPVSATGSPDSGGLAMTIAHITAALVAAWWLRRGERAAWALARRMAALSAYPLWALRSLAALADAAFLDPPRAPAGPYGITPPIRPTSTLPRGPVTRRGPPFGSMALITCR